MITIDVDSDEWLRIMRGRLELTQGALAKRLGVTRQVINYYENGLLKIPPARMELIRRWTEGNDEIPS